MLRTRTMMISIFLTITSLFMIMTMYSVTVGQDSIQQSVGQSSVLLAQDMARFIEFGITVKIDALVDYSKTSLIQNALLKSNQEFSELENVQAYITQQDDDWKSVPDETITPFMQSLISNKVAESIRKNFVEKINPRIGHSVFAELFITNAYGANIAQSGKTSDYRQDDEDWWHETRTKGINIDKTEYDESAKTDVIPIEIKIVDENGNFIGILKAGLSLRSTIREAEIFTQSDISTEVNIITEKGNIVYSTKAFSWKEDISDLIFFKKLQSGQQEGFFVNEGKFKTDLVAYARPHNLSVLGEQDWIFVIKHQIGKVGILSGMITLRDNLILASVVIIGIAVGLGIVFSRSFSSQFTKLTYLAKEIGKEHFDVKINLEGKGEMAQLLKNMHNMGIALKNAKKSKEDFVARITHDLKQPLVPILGNVDLLELPEMGELNEMQRESVDEIHNRTNLLLSMIENLMTAQKLGSGSMKYNIEELSTKNILNECIKTHFPIMKDKKIKYFDSSTEDIKIKGDGKRIQEIFTNLVQNAHDFVPEKGKIEIGVNDGEKQVTFFVKDNGEGIPKEKQDKLFKKYGQVKSKASRQYGGTGLGLVVSKELVEGMKGKIWLVSYVGKGTTFLFTIPRAEIKEKTSFEKFEDEFVDRDKVKRAKKGLKKSGLSDTQPKLNKGE